MAKARPREIDREAIKMATANENTIPMFANVRSMPDAMPNASGGAAFITAELLAGKKKLAPMPLMMLASTTTHSPVVTGEARLVHPDPAEHIAQPPDLGWPAA